MVRVQFTMWATSRMEAMKMLTYQVRKRAFEVKHPASLTFPDKATASFVFQPLQPFGMDAGGGRTTVHGVAASVHYDMNTGIHSVESAEPLEKLDVRIEVQEVVARLDGNVFTISADVDSIGELTDLVGGFFYGFPALLNVEFADPPYIERVFGTVGTTKFRWVLQKSALPFVLTDQDMQEQKFVDAWKRIRLINQGKHRRLLGALAYFHTACRLSRAGCSPWEFMSEVVLNLAKVLETLFPSKGDSASIECAREGLSSLGYSKEEIERNYIPAIALRNTVDVGHVFLSILNEKQLDTIYGFTESSENNFRDLLDRVMDSLTEGTFCLKEHDDMSPSSDVIRILQRMADQATTRTT